MTDAKFDPYHKWLGIPPAEQPPSHYRLLGLAAFEADGDVIDAAANRQMAFLQTCANGPHAAASQRLLTEVAAARLVLLGGKRDAYDATLRAAVPANVVAPATSASLAVVPPVVRRLAAPPRVVAVAEVVEDDSPGLRVRPRSRPAGTGGSAKLLAAVGVAAFCVAAAFGAWALFGRGHRPAVAAVAEPAEPAPAVTQPVANAVAPLTKPAFLSAQPAESGWVPLFNGNDLAGWAVATGEAKRWSVAGGELVATGTGFKNESWLMTEKGYGDFALRFEFQSASGASGGVAFRVEPSDAMIRGLKFMDDAGRGPFAVENVERTGVLWSKGMMLSVKKPARLRPAGEWNDATVELTQKLLTVAVNGEAVQSIDLGHYADEAKEWPPFARPAGRIAFQCHSGVMKYRKIEVRESVAAVPPAALPPTDAQRPVVVVKTSLGEFRIELYPDKAPRTVERFLDYADRGVYANSVFSMARPGWALLGGGLTPELQPTNRATTLDNERDTGLPFTYGSVAMFEHKGGVAYADFAVSLGDNQGTSEWAFGKVVAGLDVVKKIAAVNTQTRGGYLNVPTPNVVIESVSRARGTFWLGEVPTPAPPGDAPAPSALASEVRRFEGHHDIVWGVAISPNGKYALSGSGGGFADGKFLAATDSTLRLWSVESGRELAKFGGFGAWVTCVAFSPDGRQFVAGSDDSYLRLYDVTTTKHVRTFFGHKGAIKVVAFSPDGRSVAGGGGTFNGEADKDFAVRVWEVESGRLAHTLVGHAKRVWGVTFSPDGKRVVSSSGDSTVRVWDALSGSQLHTSFGRGNLNGVAFLAGGRRVAYGRGSEVGVLDAFDGTAFPSLKGHDGEVKAVAVSPDGTRLLSGGRDGQILLWDATTGVKLGELKGHTEAVTGVAFSKDGRTAISGSFDKSVRLWRLPR